MPRRLLVIAGLLLLLPVHPAGIGPRAQSPVPARSPLFVDASAFDRAGLPVTDLTAGDFQVTIDGQPGRAVSAGYVFRGPEAAERAASAAARSGRDAQFETPRAILLVVDEAGLSASDEKPVKAAISKVLDRLGPQDGAAVVALPGALKQVVLVSDRRPLRDAASRIRGRAVQYGLLAEAEAGRAQQNARVADDDPQNERQPPLAERSPGLARELAANAQAGETDPITVPNGPALQSLARIVTGLRGVRGLKSVVFVTGGLSRFEAMRSDPRASVNAIREAAAAAHVIVHVVSVSRTPRVADSDRELERIAGETGGTLSQTSGGGAGLERLESALAGGYLLELADAAGDHPGPARSVTVTVGRTGVALLAPARCLPRDDPRPGFGVATLGPASRGDAARSTALSGRSTSVTLHRPTAPPDPQLVPVFARASAYLATYLERFSTVVAEETYDQRLSGVTRTVISNSPYRLTRRLVSDLLLIRVEGPDVWIPFRDVLSVDGKPVRDREARLRKLFLDDPGRAMREARRITEEGARYNLGSVYRTLNLPTLPLVFLMPGHVSGFVFQRRGEEPVEGSTAWRIDYRETGTPTVIRRAKSNEDMPASGSLWVDPATGRILKTLVKAGDEFFQMATTVTYRHDAELDLWVPAEMSEHYVQRGETIDCTARYAHFRRFQVTTEEKIKITKDEP